MSFALEYETFDERINAMSFMFNPFPYEDPNPVNRPTLDDGIINSIITGPLAVSAQLTKEIKSRLKNKAGLTICMDGYTSSDWLPLTNLLAGDLAKEGISSNLYDLACCYKSSDEINVMLEDHLPEDRQQDPVLLFGKLFKGGYESLFDNDKLAALKETLGDNDDNTMLVNIVYGAGACSEEIRSLGDMTIYLDVTPKQAVLRIKNGQYRNLGDTTARPYKMRMRRCYFYDFELAMHLRMHLLKNDLIDFYIASDNPDQIQLIPRDAFNGICASLIQYPFRCKPVYLEGVWGGYYIKKLRNLPDEMKNCAWVFDLIPLEVSLLVEAGQNIVELPFFTFVCSQGEKLMGRECVDTFGGYFPIRFNYDDTYHSNGNMSIQLHPQTDYIKKNFNEHTRQDESYYIIATGHGAKTYIGLQENSDAKEFIEATKKSEVDYSPIDYEKYVSHVESKPGVQLMLPAGTIHSSGRNQLILEIGSLTVGSYTFKMYDYLRPDLDGKPRPIHTYHGERTLDTTRKSSWVSENLVQNPKEIRSGDGWAEYVIGDSDLLYFNLYRYEFEKKIEGNTDGVFHVLNLVDGEKVAVYPKDHPERRYEQNFLDVVVVPAHVGAYVIENLGDQPVCVHKTCLKKNFKDYV
jgi:mannose-6-phosphate isomerase